ncbi:MAG: hypothetical protein U1D30_11775 [Planctomycetota bacterium]
MFLHCLLLIFAVGSDPAERGPHRVGAVTLEIVDESRGGRLLRTEVWYPTETTDGTNAKPSGLAAKSSALRGAKPAPGPYPLLVFSHGLLAVREQSTFLTEHLASHGYVVVSADHQYNTARDFRASEVYQSGIDRPKDVSLLIDRMTLKSADPEDPFHGRLNLEKIAVLGHSYGGYTALAVGGASVNGREIALRRKLSVIPEGDYEFGDKRVAAVIAYAPVGPPVFSATGLAKLRRPTLVFGGTVDDVTPFEEHQRPIFEHAGGPVYLAAIDGGTHYSFNNEELSRVIQLFIKNKPAITRSESDPMIFRVTLAFLERYLLGSNRWDEYLNSTVPRLEIRTRNVESSSKTINPMFSKPMP